MTENKIAKILVNIFFVTIQHQMKKYRKMNNVKYSIYNEQIKKIK